MPKIADMVVAFELDVAKANADAKVFGDNIERVGEQIASTAKKTGSLPSAIDKVGTSQGLLADTTREADIFLRSFRGGMDDLSAGLPSVATNLDSVALSLRGLEDSGAEESMGGLSTEANAVVVGVTLLVSGFMLLAKTIKKEMADAANATKGLGTALSEMFGDLKPVSDIELDLPKDPAKLKEIAASFKNYAKSLEDTAIAQGKMSKTQFVSAGPGAPAIAINPPSKEQLDSFRDAENVSEGARKKIEEYADSLEAMALIQEFVTANLSDYIKNNKAAAGSIDAIEEKLKKLRLQYKATADDVLRAGIDKDIKKLELELTNMSWAWKNVVQVMQETATELPEVALELGSAVGSAQFLRDALVELRAAWDEAVPGADKDGLVAKIKELEAALTSMNSVFDKPKKEIIFLDGSFGKLGQTLDKLGDEYEAATTASDRFAIGMKMNAIETRMRVEQEMEKMAETMKNFRMDALLDVGDAAVGGAFGGFFKEFEGASANNARLSLVQLTEEFSSLEEALANGDISYAEFAARNAIRMDEMKDAQRELALATRNNFELMADRIGNAFVGMKDMVIQSFKDIAQEYTKLLVRRGVLKILETVLGVPTGLPSGVTAGPASAPVGAAFRTQNMRPFITSSVLSSGDLQISVGQANTFSKRTGV